MWHTRTHAHNNDAHTIHTYTHISLNNDHIRTTFKIKFSWSYSHCCLRVIVIIINYCAPGGLSDRIYVPILGIETWLCGGPSSMCHTDDFTWGKWALWSLLIKTLTLLVRDPVVLLYPLTKASSQNTRNRNQGFNNGVRGSHKHTGHWIHTACDTFIDHPTQTISGPAHCSAFMSFPTLKEYRTRM